MEITTIEIRNITSHGLCSDVEGMHHRKTLPVLSVVQSVHGSYEIGLDEETPFFTGEGGAFVAPAGVRQDIVHHNGDGGYMQARWVFMNVVLNGMFALEEVYELPRRIPPAREALLSRWMEAISSGVSVCARYAACYELTELLLSEAKKKPCAFEDTPAHLRRFVDEHFAEPITAETLAETAICSVASLYRLFQNHFHTSPHNYINSVRLGKAAVLLEERVDSVAAVGAKVGFEDPAYFSRLFKKQYGLSPAQYMQMLDARRM